MDADQILACQFSRWYPHFQDVTFRSIVVQLPPQLVDYLVQDGVFLGNGSRAMPRRAKPAAEDEYSDWTEDEGKADDSGEGLPQVPEFPELNEEIDAAIMQLGDSVAPKLSWSSPHDAVWVSSSNSLACSNAEEVLLLLKSSDRIAHDICNAFDGCHEKPAQPVAHTLALRKWVALKPEREFRCFVRGYDLVAVSQRNMRENPGGLEQQKDDLAELLLEFYEQHLQHRFSLSDYTFDVYITTAGKVRLIDFNPIGGTTSPLLFDWDELQYDMLTSSTPTHAAASHDSVSDSASGAAPGGSSALQTPELQSGQVKAGGGSSRILPSANGFHSTTGHSAAAEADATGRQDAEDGGNCLAGQPGALPWQPGSSGHGRGGGIIGGDQGPAEIMIRFSTESGAIRPNAAAYGAPYDLVDCSDGSAISEMLQRLTASRADNGDGF